MESLFIVNPRGRKKRKGRMPAGLRKYWAARRRQKNPVRRKRRARAANPRRHTRRARRANPIKSYRRKRRANPIHYGTHKRRKRRANPIHYGRRRKRHHNPFSTGGLMAVLKPAGIGAAGAIATAIAYGYAAPMLPATLTTGYIPVIVKAAAAIGLGMLISKFMSKQDGQYATIGGLTVVLVGAVTPLITSAAPTLPGLSGLAGYGDYMPTKMGAYAPTLSNPKTTRFGRLGFISPAPKLGAYMGRGIPQGLGALSGSGYNGLNDGM
jgi:hypothetical protein